MRKIITILIIIAVLLSGCVSKTTNNKKTDSNGHEYADDGTSEEIAQDTIQADYNNLDMNSKNPISAAQENISRNTIEDVTIKTS